jgi:membrane protein YqaA with SNARE-associated domain
MAAHATSPPALAPPEQDEPRAWLQPALLLLGALAASAVLLLAPIDYRALGAHGYLGVFLVTLVATAALVLPVPYLAVIVVAGSFLDPALVGLVAGLAAALGELTGYFVGRAGRSLLPRNRWYLLVERCVSRFGGLAVFLGALVPNPLFDAVGVVAGALRLPLWRFLLIVFAGKALRFWLLAVLGGGVLAA